MCEVVKEDYPTNQMEFECRFSSEEACREYLVQLRWPNGVACPQCGGSRLWRGSRGRLICGSCRHQASATAATIFQGTHKPLRLWFQAMWYVTGQKTGASALGLQRVLGLGSYQTAWTWLHKLRRAMVRPGRDRLRGRVEVDEVLIGGTEPGFEGRSAPRKSLVAIAAAEDGDGIGRIRMARIRNAEKSTLHRFVQQSVQPGSVVHTDGWTSYLGLGRKGYGHERTVLQGRSKQTATVTMP